MLARTILACMLLAGCGAPAAQGGRPTSRATEARPAEIAIAEPATDNAVDEDPVAPDSDAAIGELSGEWIEDWPDRGGCADRVVVTRVGSEVEIAGSDCNDGEAYEYSQIEATSSGLRFSLRVPSTERVLHYDLELEAGRLVGSVTGGAQATVTWRRAK